MSQYKGIKKILKNYFDAYGGWKAIFFSPYLQLSAIITVLCLNIWATDSKWKELIVQIIPNLLGFSIGAFAILFSAFQGKVGPIMLTKENGDHHSPAEILSSTFVHFIVVQSLTLIIGIFSYSGLGSVLTNTAIKLGIQDQASYFLVPLYLMYKFIGFLLFIYAIMMLISATMAIFRTIRWEVDANND